MEFTTEQANAFRLKRQYLTTRADSPAQILGGIFGVQSQVFSAADFNINSRLKRMEAGIVDKAIRERDVIKTWGMRGTLHLFHPTDFHIYIGATRHRDRAWELGYASYYGLCEREYDRAVEVILGALDGTPKTREELGVVLNGSKEGLATKCLASWGGILKALALKGLICFGPDKNGKATFVDTSSWIIDKFETLSDPEAEFLRRYLRMYGPATVQDFAYWSGLKVRSARKIWDMLRSEMTSIMVSGSEAYVLSRDIQELSVSASDEYNIVSYFDTFLLGHKYRDHFVERQLYSRVSRKSGWIYPVILRGGKIIGIWSFRKFSSRIEISVEMLNGRTLPRRLKSEFEKYKDYFRKEVILRTATV